MSTPTEGVCYLCGQQSSRLRYVCVYERDNPILCYLCPDCHIYAGPDRNIENLPEVRWKERNHETDRESDV